VAPLVSKSSAGPSVVSCHKHFLIFAQDERGFVVVQFDAIRVEKEGSIMAFMNLFYKHRSVTVAKYGLVRDRSDGSGILRRRNQCVRLSSHSTAAAIGESLRAFQLCLGLHSGLRGSKHAAENENVILCVMNKIVIDNALYKFQNQTLGETLLG
jgi:hypothetical protein